MFVSSSHSKNLSPRVLRGGRNISTVEAFLLEYIFVDSFTQSELPEFCGVVEIILFLLIVLQSELPELCEVVEIILQSKLFFLSYFC